ncbi:MAG: hypothetical protein JWO67_3211 [Streptosporangiaceae bacterium]|nr:hypothetical protein [Streptosporangiaceae bacterium]
MAEARNSPRRISARVKRLRAVQLKIAGATYQQIADTPTDAANGDMRALYPNRQRAFEAVDAALKETAKETEGSASELRELELQRLDSLHMSLWPATRPSRAVNCEQCGSTLWRDTDLQAIGRVLDVMKRRASLAGLDAADTTDERLVNVLQQQVDLASQAMLGAMEKAGIPAEKQREVMGHAAALLREADQARG